MSNFQRQIRLQDLMHRDGRQCQHCNRRVRIVKLKAGERQPKDMATEDHVIPRSAGGSDDLANLLLACFPCNNDRGDMPIEAFRARREKRP